MFRCHKINTQEEFCIKIVKKNDISPYVLNSIMREIDILRQINQGQCENLVHVWEVFDETDAFYIIMEICNYDLKYEFDMLKKQKTWYTEKE